MIIWIPQLVVILCLLLAAPLYKDFRKWVMHGYLFSNPVSVFIYKDNFITSADIFLCMMVFIFFADLSLEKNKSFPRNKYVNSILFFGVAIFLSLVDSQYVKRVIWPLFFYLKALIIFLYIIKYFDASQLEDVFIVFLLSGIAPAVYGIVTDWGAVKGLTEKSSYFTRAVSTFSGPVEFGYQMAIRVSVLLALSWKSQSIRKMLLKILLLFVFLLSVAISFTRNSYIVVIASMFIVLLVKGWQIVKRKGIWNVIPSLCLLGIIVFILWVILPHRIYARFGMLRLGGLDPSIAARPLLWEAAWRMFLDHPVTGVGFGSFTVMFDKQYVPHALSQMAKVGFNSAHSIIFMILSELGLIGVISVSMILFTFGKAVFQSMARASDPWRGYLIASLVLGTSTFMFGLFDFVWVHERSASSIGFLLALSVMSVNAPQVVQTLKQCSPVTLNKSLGRDYINSNTR